MPALISLLALLVLTALVWWRVLHRSDGGTQASSCPTSQPPAKTLPAPNRVTLEVLNATHRNGIAAKARAALLEVGFNIPKEAANDKAKVKIRGVAEIRFGPNGRDAAELVHYYLPGARLVAKHKKTATVVISLGGRYRGVASPSAVQAALSRKDIALDTATPGAPTPSPTC